MIETPETPQECPICRRAEDALRSCPVLANKVSDDELAAIVQRVQAAILKKEITKSTRGIQMAEEKYVMNKSSFEDLYDTMSTLISINGKMADRIERQDKTIMKALGIVAEHDAVLKAMAEDAPVYVEEEEETEDIGDPLEDVEGEDSESEDSVASGEEEDIEDEVPAEEAPAEKLPSGFPMKEAAQKALFEAGYKAAFAEIQKKNGVTVAPAEFAKDTSRPIATADAQAVAVVEDMNKSLPADNELANMSASQMNAWLREHKL